jgi:hypothetical protein
MAGGGGEPWFLISSSPVGGRACRSETSLQRRFSILLLNSEGREVPGLGELLRSSGARHNQRSWLSRSTAVLFRQTLVLCLPGSPSAVTEGLSAIGDLLAHGLHTSHGGGHGDSLGAKPSVGSDDRSHKE